MGTEAAFHGIEEYMEHVEEWFKLQERIPGRIDKRRVYLASDDPKVLPDAIQKSVHLIISLSLKWLIIVFKTFLMLTSILLNVRSNMKLTSSALDC